jgi:putative ATP-grasp target RiPP
MTTSVVLPTLTRPWGAGRLAPYPTATRRPHATVTIDPTTQLGVFRDRTGQVVEMGRPVLVATEADDISADMVISELNRRDVPVVRFNPADVGGDLTVSARFGTCPAPVVGQIRTPSRAADLTRVRSVYWRRPAWPSFRQPVPGRLPFRGGAGPLRAWGHALRLGRPALGHHPLRIAAADYKPVQLALAQQLGFTIPPTLVFNNSTEAREFIRMQGDAIFKTLRWTPYRRQAVGTGRESRVSTALGP